MIYTAFALGCFVGATVGVLIMALVVAGKGSSENLYNHREEQNELKIIKANS